MGSRSHPHRVLSVCVCVCVSRCLWVCVIEADSLQLRVITVGLYQFLSRSLSCQILAVCGRRLRSVSGSWFRDSWALLLSWTPIAGDSSAHCFPALPASAYEELHFSFSLCITSCNKLSFRNWILPSSLWQKDLTNLHGFSGDSWFAGTVSRQQRSYGSPGGEYAEHRTSCAGVSSAVVRAHYPGTVIEITRCATHTA